MDRLDDLEAQSIFIFREAFARMKKLALLWSLGKDSNVMIWLARKAFFGHLPFPVMHVDTGKKFPEMYAFRDRYAREWDARSHRRAVPAARRGRPDAAARRALGRAQDRRAQARAGQARLRRPDRRHPPRRGSDPRQGAGVLAARPRRQLGRPRPAAGVLGPFQCAAPGRARICASIPILHWTETDIWTYTRREGIPIIPLYLAKDGKRYRSLGDADITFPVPSQARTIDEIIAELDVTKTPERSGRAMDHEAEDAFERLRASGYL